MAILIADSLPAAAVERFASLRREIRFQPSTTADDLETGALDGVEVLIVRSTRVTERAIAHAPALGLIVRAGAAYNTIDVAAASARGITVANCPGKNAIAVAELALGLLLAVDRRIPEATARLREGRWAKKSLATARGLYGRTLGVLGVGTIGTAVIERARAFGLHVLAWSRSLTPEQARALGVVFCETPLEVAAGADFVTVHLASAPGTRKLVGADFFARMKTGAVLINCARGDVVDQEALRHAMQERDLRAGLDVFDPEPAGGDAPFDDPIAREPNLVAATHHLGASTEQATMATALEALRVVEAYLAEGEAPASVNIGNLPHSTHGVVVRHYDRVGVLAGVLSVLRAAELNVREMTNRLFDSGGTASAKIMLDRLPDPTTMERLRTECEGVIRVEVVDASGR
jgi:D-3-phosphoglycerate dehydrogenase / 2-oxoglutarate reductase